MTDLPTASSDTWNTPATLIELVRRVMRGIDVDPATNAGAQAVIRAATFYTLETDGLAHDWHGRVFLNPPYSDPAPFVMRLLGEYDADNTTEAIALVNARTGSAWFQALAVRAWRCELRARVRFWRPDRLEGSVGRLSSVVFYLGPNARRFVNVFGSEGVTSPPASRNAPTCSICSGPIVSSRADAAYCSGACRQKAFRSRKKPGPPFAA